MHPKNMPSKIIEIAADKDRKDTLKDLKEKLKREYIITSTVLLMLSYWKFDSLGILINQTQTHLSINVTVSFYCYVNFL